MKTLKDLLKDTPVTALHGDGSTTVAALAYDSRAVTRSDCFFATRGTQSDGHDFIPDAVAKGASAVVCEQLPAETAHGVAYVVVPDAAGALADMAAAFYGHPSRELKLVGITGTNGKTTTKELIAAVLSRRYRLLYTEGNLNNHIGVPLTLLRLRPEHELAVVEMGASHPGDIRELVEIAEPDMGLITNVGKAHLEGFGSFEGVMRTKGELYDWLRKLPAPLVFLHADNPYLTKMAAGLPHVTYGKGDTNYISGQLTSCSPFLAFAWKKQGETETHQVQTQLIGSYNLPNALAAVTIGTYFDVDAALIDQALTEYAPQNNRSQLKQTADNTLIIDAYNANPTSMMASLTNFRQMEVVHKVVILGDMRELGQDSAEEHQKIVDYLKECDFERIILVGSQFATTRHSYETYADAPALIEALKQEKPTGKTILIKGSNGIRLSTVVDYL